MSKANQPVDVTPKKERSALSFKREIFALKKVARIEEASITELMIDVRNLKTEVTKYQKELKESESNHYNEARNLNEQLQTERAKVVKLQHEIFNLKEVIVKATTKLVTELPPADPLNDIHNNY